MTRPPLSVSEAAARLNQSKDAVLTLCRIGGFRGAYKIGAQGPSSPWRIPATAIDTYEHLRTTTA